MEYANHCSNEFRKSADCQSFWKKKEITCNQAGKQKFNYWLRQSVHAYISKPQTRRHCNANSFQITLLFMGFCVLYRKEKKRAASHFQRYAENHECRSHFLWSTCLAWRGGQPIFRVVSIFDILLNRGNIYPNALHYFSNETHNKLNWLPKNSLIFKLKNVCVER